MNYFKMLSLIFGALLILTRLLIHLFPKQWNLFELNKAYTEKQPKWVWIVALVGLIILAVTWYMHLSQDVPYSLIITLFLSLTLIKTSQVLFNYQKFRAFVIRVLTKDRHVLVRINVLVFILGIILILMGVFLY